MILSHMNALIFFRILLLHMGHSLTAEEHLSIVDNFGY